MIIRTKLLSRPFKIVRKCFGTFKAEWESHDTPIDDHSAKTVRTRAYGWGLTGNGELGVREFIDPKRHLRPLSNTWCPCRIPFADTHKVSFAACGHGFTLFAVSNSKGQPKLYGTGVNTFGQLGYHGHPQEKSKCLSWLIEPAPIMLPLKSKTTKISHVACGLGHTIIATDKEGLFSLGNNSQGQCGRKPIEDEDYASHPRVHKVHDVPTPIKQLVCGLDHTLVLTADGRVLAFGLGTDGQLGDNTFVSNWIPTEVGGDLKNEKIVQISTSADCCLAVSDKGDVFGWGNSEYKQLSSVTTGIQAWPVRNFTCYDVFYVGIPVKLDLNVGKVKRVATGGSVCLVLTETGQVYSWGYGFLGLGPENIIKAKPTLLPAPLFGANVYNEDVTVVDIVAGVTNFAAINNKAELFMWGKNHFGSLGFRHDREQFFPLKVDLGYTLVSISLAPYHTVAVVRTNR